MDTKRRLGRIGALGLALALLAVPVVRAAAADPPPGELKGSGSLAGTELVQEERFTGSICFEATKTLFGLRGIGTYHGRTAAGGEVVYKAEISGNQTLFGDGPIQVQVENTQTYYHGPYGTHGTSDATCAPATAGTPVPAEFRVLAPDHLYRLDGANQVPCVGHGTYARTGADDNPNWHAQWAFDADCTVVGNAAGTPGTGVAPAGTVHTDDGVHRACFSGSCVDNVRVDYKQYLPFRGLHLVATGPDTATVGSAAAVTAIVTRDGLPVPNATVSFSVSGPAPAAPPTGAAVTGGDGKASFTFTAATEGAFTVAASVTQGPDTASGAHVVTFGPTPPPVLALDGPAAAQTEEDVTFSATVTNAGNPVPGAQVNFTVTGPGQAQPASGSVMTDANGKAPFTFRADRSGDYGVDATATVALQTLSAHKGVHLDINTFSFAGRLQTPDDTVAHGSAVIDPAGDFAYFGGNSQIYKVDMRTLQLVGTLPHTGSIFQTAVIDPAGTYAYFGNDNAPGQVVKVDLSTFQIAGVLTLLHDAPPAVTGEDNLTSAVIDPAGRYAYFGTTDSLSDTTRTAGRVVKVDLASFTRVGAVTLAPGETWLQSAVMDPLGRYAYFGAAGVGSTAGSIVRIDLATFQRAGAVGLDGAEENRPTSAVIDRQGAYAYFSTLGGTSAARIVKIDLDTLLRVSVLAPTKALESARGTPGALDPAGRYAYFGMSQPGVPRPTNPFSPGPSPSVVARIDLATFQHVYSVPLPAGDFGQLASAVIDPQGRFAYFGKASFRSDVTLPTVPPEVTKFAVSRPPVAWLVAVNDAYSTPYASPLSVPAPGVLANDDDTQDNDPLNASLVKDPAHGDVTLNPNGSFTYTPESSFSGTDTFTYFFDDGMNVSAPATVSITVAAPPQGVQAVSGSAFGFETNVSLFGGPAAVKGGPGSTCGQSGQPACADGQSPAANLPPNGGDVSATDPDGNVGQYGPAYIFENHGPLTVRTQGATGPAGAVLSSASVKDIADNDPFHAGGPDGEASSTCTATRTTLGGSSRIVNGRLVTSTDPSTGDPATEVTFPHDWAPAPNTEYRGTLNHVGDSWRIVFNEQILGPETITVNAVHMYLLGPTAVGDMVIGSSRCGVVTSAANAAPVGNDDAYTATAGRPLVVPAAGVLANDTDADGQPLTAAKPAGTRPPASGGGAWAFPGEPAHGTLDLRADGSFTYTPAPGYAGPDSFTYLAQDSRGKSDPATVSLTVAPAARKAVADFDGNGSTDLSVFRPSSGTWYLQGSAHANYGASGDIAVPADYDGDGKADVAVFRPSNGVWYVHGSAGADTAVAFGASGDIPVPADYDGDGKADIAVFRNGVWYLHGSAGADTATAFGTAGDVPVPADYDGDGKADVAVFRNGVWYVKGSAGADTATAFGTTGDVPVPGDYDANGTVEMAVFRPSAGVWFVQGGAATAWGTNGDIPVPGDYDGDGDLDIAVFRPSNGVWFVHGGATTAWGTTGDVPLPLPAAVYRSMG